MFLTDTFLEINDMNNLFYPTLSCVFQYLCAISRINDYLFGFGYIEIIIVYVDRIAHWIKNL